MKVLVTGVCGFVGSALATCLIERVEGLCVVGMDNMIQPGSETNRLLLEKMGIKLIHADLRSASDLEELPDCDWVIDAAANPSVVAGLSGNGASRRLFEHNVSAIGNLVEYCRERRAGLILLSTSRVYSIGSMLAIPLHVKDRAFVLDSTKRLPDGLTGKGIGVGFSTVPPLSLYGATKLASEIIAQEFGVAFDFPVWITRCGVLAGAGQFGTPAQGIFAYWINAHLRRRPLRYIGFEGTDHQTRDVFHLRDLAALLIAQMHESRVGGQRIYTAGGGPTNSMSLAQLTAWCDERFGRHSPIADREPRVYDIPWVAMDNDAAMRDFSWQIELPLPVILNEIACHAEIHSEWLDVSRA
jgi:CDP-paratose 2-epimerase